VNKQMMRLGFLLVGSGCFMVPVVLGQTGCFGSGSGVTTTTGSSSTDTGSSSTATSSGDGGSTSASTSGGMPPACSSPALVIDDMSNTAGPTLTGGYWYTYSDRTCVSPLPALIRGDAAGTVTPLEGQQFLAITGASNDGPNPCGTGAVSYRDFSGSGENNWGAGMGFDFADTAPSSPFMAASAQVLGQSCASAEQCTGMEAPDAYTPPADAGGSFAAPFDVSMHKGISFYVRAPDAAVKVKVQLSDKTTNPAGGTCDQCLYGGPAASATTIRCADDWLKTLSLSTSWTQVTLMFNDPLLKTGGWSTSNMTRPSSAMDLKSLYYVHFQISTADYPAPVKAFHFQVAYISFVD
jgi:hypothetical protein